MWRMCTASPPQYRKFYMDIGPGGPRAPLGARSADVRFPELVLCAPRPLGCEPLLPPTPPLQTREFQEKLFEDRRRPAASVELSCTAECPKRRLYFGFSRKH